MGKAQLKATKLARAQLNVFHNLYDKGVSLP